MAGQLAERFQVPDIFDDVDQLLKEARADVVHVTTPPQSHFKLAQEVPRSRMPCLRRKAVLHGFATKPMRWWALAEERGLKITAGHNVQFSPEMIRMRELVRTGILGGVPVHVDSVFSYDSGDASYVESLLG